MIKKTINYCWFGRKPLPGSFSKILESWQRFCPGYKIVQWDESNYCLDSIPYLKVAVAKGNYAFVSDYARLDIIRRNGGVYLDIDVELIRPIEDILKKGPFFAMEEVDRINTGLAFGADAGNTVIDSLCKIYENYSYEEAARVLSESNTVEIVTNFLRKHGFKFNGKTQIVDGFIVYRPSVFCPLQYGEKRPRIKSDTVSIHHFSGSWVNTSSLSISAQLRHARVARRLKKLFGVRFFYFIKEIYTPLFGRKNGFLRVNKR